MKDAPGGMPEGAERAEHARSPAPASTVSPSSSTTPSPGAGLLALVLLVPAPSIGVLLALWWFPDSWGKFAWLVSKLHLLVFPLLWWRLVERGRLGLSPVRHGGIGPGLLSGFAIAAAILVLYELVGRRLIEPELLVGLLESNGIDSELRYLGLAAYLTLVNALVEEYVWRWFVFRQCTGLLRGRGIPAALLSALLFSVHHFLAVLAYFDLPATLLASAGTFVGGALWSLLYHRYRSIWPGYLSHVCADEAVFIIGWRLLFGG